MYNHARFAARPDTGNGLARGFLQELSGKKED
jgi:hypothetical protein